MKKYFNKKLILISVLIIVLSTIIEIFLSNIDYFITKNHGTIALNDYSKIEVVDESTKYYYENLDMYIDYLDLYFNQNMSSIKINLYKIDNDNTINLATDMYTENDTKKVKINDNVNNLIIEVNSDKDLVKKVEVFNNFEFTIFRFLFLLISFSFTYYIVDSIINKRGIKLELLFLFFSLSFGTLLLLTNPIHYSWDEQEHFSKAYNLSQGNFIMRTGEEILWPENADIFFRYGPGSRTINGYRDFVEQYGLINKMTDNNYTYQYINSTAIPYLFVPYIFSAMGIFVSRLFGASLLTQYYFGRLFNLLLYTAICYIALKKIKQGTFKNILFLITLLPLTIFQGGSLSADVMTNCFSFLAFAIAISCSYKQEKFSNRDKILLLISCSVVTISKVAYFPIFLLFLFIPKENYESTKDKKRYIIIAFLLAIILFLMCSLYSSKLGLVQWPVPGVDTKGQILYIIKNPIVFIKVLYNTLNLNINNYLSSITFLAYNGNLGNIPYLISIFTLFYMGLVENKNTFSLRQKIVLLTIILGCLGASMSSLYITYTPVGNSIVEGFQGRYLIPIIFPIILLLNRRNGIKLRQEKLNIYTIILTFILLIMSSLLILNNYYL